MEYLEGTTLTEKLRKGPLPLNQLFQFGIQIASALAETHRHGVIHRNLKPGNIMLTTSGPELLDFGFAKPGRGGLSADGSAVENPATRSSLLLGESPYSAPEQVERRNIDGRADLFALGAILYEMATGTLPFKADQRGRGCRRDPKSRTAIAGDDSATDPIRVGSRDQAMSDQGS